MSALSIILQYIGYRLFSSHLLYRLLRAVCVHPAICQQLIYVVAVKYNACFVYVIFLLLLPVYFST